MAYDESCYVVSGAAVDELSRLAHCDGCSQPVLTFSRNERAIYAAKADDSGRIWIDFEEREYEPFDDNEDIRVACSCGAFVSITSENYVD